MYKISLFNKLSKLSEKQNQIISGDETTNWRHKTNLEDIKMASFSEFAEFLEEIKSDWCWWKDCKFDIENAREEFIDVLMFLFGVVNYGREPYEEIEDKIALASFMNHKKYTPIDVNTPKKKMMYDFTEVNRGGRLIGPLFSFIDTVGNYLGMSSEDIIDEWKKKMDHNLNSRPNWGHNRD